MTKRHRRIATLAAVVVVSTVVALRIVTTTDVGRTAAPTPRSAATPRISVDPTPVGPARVNALGISQGWRHDRDGASAAAAAAVRSTGAIARARFITRADMIRSLTTGAYAPTLASLSASELGEMTAELGDAKVTPSELVWSEIPLTERVVAADDLTARLQVWSVLVVAVPDVGAPRQLWRTVTIDLAWESDDWKISGWASTPGPTPLLDADSAVASTAQIAEVTGWPAATVGGG
jgi:hypothetical protein